MTLYDMWDSLERTQPMIVRSRYSDLWFFIPVYGESHTFDTWRQAMDYADEQTRK